MLELDRKKILLLVIYTDLDSHKKKLIVRKLSIFGK